MKTKEQVQQEMKFGDIFTLKEFMECVDCGAFIPYDGVGYFHDGENRTNLCVWDDSLKWDDIKDFPYVCWYNR